MVTTLGGGTKSYFMLKYNNFRSLVKCLTLGSLKGLNILFTVKPALIVKFYPFLPVIAVW